MFWYLGTIWVVQGAGTTVWKQCGWWDRVCVLLEEILWYSGDRSTIFSVEIYSNEPVTSWHIPSTTLLSTLTPMTTIRTAQSHAPSVATSIANSANGTCSALQLGSFLDSLLDGRLLKCSKHLSSDSISRWHQPASIIPTHPILTVDKPIVVR